MSWDSHDLAAELVDRLRRWRQSQYVHLQHRGHRHVRVRTEIFADAVDSGRVKLLSHNPARHTYRAVVREGIDLDGFHSKLWQLFHIRWVDFTIVPQASSWDRLLDPII